MSEKERKIGKRDWRNIKERVREEKLTKGWRESRKLEKQIDIKNNRCTELGQCVNLNIGKS